MRRRCLPVQGERKITPGHGHPEIGCRCCQLRKILDKKRRCCITLLSFLLPSDGTLAMTAVNPSVKRCESSRREQCQSSIPL